MLTLWMETIFIGNVGDVESLIGDRVDPTVATPNGKSFVFGASIR